MYSCLFYCLLVGSTGRRQGFLLLPPPFLLLLYLCNLDARSLTRLSRLFDSLSLRLSPSQEDVGFHGAAAYTNNWAEKGASSDPRAREDEAGQAVKHFLLLVAGVLLCWCRCNGE